MSRETKAERLEREAQARQLAVELQRREYPARLMALLERVSAEPTLILSVKDGLFRVEDRNDRYRNGYFLTYSWSDAVQSVLENLEYKVDSLEEERAEAERRYQVKREAERKVRELLSDEERELLGL